MASVDGIAGLRPAQIPESDERLVAQFYPHLRGGESVLMDAHRPAWIFENALWDSQWRF